MMKLNSVALELLLAYNEMYLNLDSGADPEGGREDRVAGKVG